MTLTTDKHRSLFRKWCTMIEAVVEAKTKDGYTLRLFVNAFTARKKNQLSKNCYAPGKLEKWVRLRITNIVKKRLVSVNINRAVSLLSHDILADALLKRCNPILPLRDLKIVKTKVIRAPKHDSAKIIESHFKIPESNEDKPRIVEAAPVVAAAPAEEKKE